MDSWMEGRMEELMNGRMDILITDEWAGGWVD